MFNWDLSLSKASGEMVINYGRYSVLRAYLKAKRLEEIIYHIHQFEISQLEAPGSSKYQNHSQFLT